MVTVDLMGYVGNQMFQIAACIGYAKKHGLDYHIDGVPPRSDIWPTYFTHLRNEKYNPNIEEVKIIEPHFHYAKLPFEESWRNKNIRLTGSGYDTGYYQTEKYFAHMYSDLSEIFGFNYDMAHCNFGYTSLHFRTGDYLRMQNYFPVVTEKYVRSAVSEIIKTTNNSKFIVFGNSVDWNKEFIEKLKIDAEFIFSEDTINNTPLQDMRLMSRCENQIIGNSSFSWWAAYLNPNPNKTVICPDENSWFGKDNKHNDTKDLIPACYAVLE